MPQEIKIDFHVHSDASPDGRNTIAQLAAAAKARGLDAICICDHDRISVRESLTVDGVTVLGGCECSTDHGHILALFFDHDFTYDRPAGAPLPRAQTVIETIHAHGGLAVLAHPCEKGQRSDNSIPGNIDAIECANARACFHNSTANDMAADLAHRHDLPALGGSDAHDRRSVGDAYTLLTLSPGQTYTDAIRAGQCRAVCVRNTPRTRKGLSQLTKAGRSGKPMKILHALCYLAYCAALDLFKKEKSSCHS